MGKYLSTKGQAWHTDFIIGAVIFTGMLAVFFTQINQFEEPEDLVLGSLLGQASSISSELLSRGFPTDWNESNAIRIGLVSSPHRIDVSKLNSLLNVPYDDARSLLRVTDEFFFFFEKNGCLLALDGNYGYGHPDVSVSGSGCVLKSDVDLSAADADNLVPITRIVIHNGTPTKLTVYAWN